MDKVKWNWQTARKITALVGMIFFGMILFNMILFNIATAAPGSGVEMQPNTPHRTVAQSTHKNPAKHVVNNVDFRRTADGGGRVTVKFSDHQVPVDVQQSDNEIIVVLSDTSIPSELERRLDVIDFATPVLFIDTYTDGDNGKLAIKTTGRFRQSSVQSDKTLTLNVAPLSEAQIESEKTDPSGYQGEKLSLNFQRISVRDALQVIADFTDLNFVTSDSINGNLSLRLRDVPWDQALHVILQTKGLAMRQKGNVVWVAPAAEIINNERVVLAAQQEKDELEPLTSELIRVSYSKVEDIAELLKSVKAVASGFSGADFSNVTLNATVNAIETEQNSLLSARGSVSVDVRTNSILIQDTPSKLKEIKALIAQLDIPVRQVQIETRIVEANDDFSRSIGARLGFTRESRGDTNQLFSGGNLEHTNNIRRDPNFSDDAFSINLPADRLGADLPGSYAFTIAKIGSNFLSLLDLELSALQAEGSGKIIANPKILTTDKRSASIEQGQERMITVDPEVGATTTRGQRAVLSLTVLPQITPDDKIILDVDITNDSFVAANIDTVNTKRIDTQALLENGETIVIGGIYQQEEAFSVSKVPVLGDLPLIGVMFRKKTTRNRRSELLIFLTPRIIDPALEVQ